MDLITLQTIQKTYPAAAEAVARVLIDAKVEGPVVELAREILKVLGFE